MTGVEVTCFNNVKKKIRWLQDCMQMRIIKLIQSLCMLEKKVIELCRREKSRKILELEKTFKHKWTVAATWINKQKSSNYNSDSCSMEIKHWQVHANFQFIQSDLYSNMCARSNINLSQLGQILAQEREKNWQKVHVQSIISDFKHMTLLECPFKFTSSYFLI